MPPPPTPPTLPNAAPKNPTSVPKTICQLNSNSWGKWFLFFFFLLSKPDQIKEKNYLRARHDDNLSDQVPIENPGRNWVVRHFPSPWNKKSPSQRKRRQKLKRNWWRERSLISDPDTSISVPTFLCFRKSQVHEWIRILLFLYNVCSYFF